MNSKLTSQRETVSQLSQDSSYTIRWKGYINELDTFEPRGNIHPDLIRDYEIEILKMTYVHGWRYRCDVCDLPCSSATRGIAINKSRDHKKVDQPYHRQVP